MKKIIITLCALLALSCKNSPKELTDYVDQFKKDAAEYNIDIDDSKFAGIYYKNYLEGGTLGLTKSYEDGSSITFILKDLDKNKEELLVYHELAHALLDREHCHEMCDEIMSAHLTDYMFYIKNKEELKRKLFLNIVH